MKIIGCDVGKNFVILYDGENFYFYGKLKDVKGRLPKKVKILNEEELPALLKNNLVVLEQTGFYGVRFAKIFQDLGAVVRVADGKEFKRFRGGRSRDKDDYIDAKYLRKMFYDDEFSKFILPFKEEKIALRALVRYKRKVEKDLTRHVNRLRQVLAAIFHNKDYHDLPRGKFFKTLPKIKKELQKETTFLKTVALSELERVESCLKSKKEVEKEISKAVKSHEDYEILSTFPYIGDITISSLIAYYHDVNNFKTADEFIAYLLMGVKKEQSGKSLNKRKTDKTRAEVKANLYMAYMNAGIKKSILHPLLKYEEIFLAGTHNRRKRFVKFADKYLRLMFKALKLRLPFEDVLEIAIREKEKQIETLEAKAEVRELTEKEYARLYRTKRLLAVYQDISDRLKERKEKAAKKGRKRRRSTSNLFPAESKTDQAVGRYREGGTDGPNQERSGQKGQGATSKRGGGTPDSHGGEVHRSLHGSSERGSIREGAKNNPIGLRNLSPGQKG